MRMCILERIKRMNVVLFFTVGLLTGMVVMAWLYDIENE